MLLGNLSFVACLPQLTHCLGTGSCPNHRILYVRQRLCEGVSLRFGPLACFGYSLEYGVNFAGAVRLSMPGSNARVPLGSHVWGIRGLQVIEPVQRITQEFFMYAQLSLSLTPNMSQFIPDPLPTCLTWRHMKLTFAKLRRDRSSRSLDPSVAPWASQPPPPSRPRLPLHELLRESSANLPTLFNNRSLILLPDELRW